MKRPEYKFELRYAHKGDIMVPIFSQSVAFDSKPRKLLEFPFLFRQSGK
jgi:hypothetical protein